MTLAGPLARPCTCDNRDTCRVCYLYHTDPRYRALWGDPGALFAPVMSARERAKSYALLERVDAVLPGHVLCWGALLGYVRYGAALPWDDDIDVLCVDPPSVPELRGRLPGLEVTAHANGNVLVFDPRDPKIPGYHHAFPFLELVPARLDGETVRANSVHHSEENAFPKDLVFPARRGTFGGVTCRVPNRPAELAAHKYGEQCLTTALPSRWSHRHERPTGFPQIRFPLPPYVEDP
ncbi:LicD family protein [Gemmata sp. SH-PL17]|uniref:LicD family protein n=1 Tax=Gemmata sp. SH-PL17 TaxID=1630693 RepID=UPI00078C7F12|nr:LicD family protein [Gemmata sp. SH-PL17]AMV24189.1 LicD family protein [Gemmata sp. SH-PL17]